MEKEDMETGVKDDHSYAKRNGDPLNECPDCRGNFTTTEHLKRHIKIEHMSDADKLAYSSENPTETSEYSVEMDDVEIGGKGENNSGIVQSANDTEIQEQNCKKYTEIQKQKNERIIQDNQNKYKSESNIVRFKCLRCDKLFASLTELSVHNESHEEDAVYKCTTCGLCFTHQSLLTNRLKEAHGQVSPDGKLKDQMNTNVGKTPNHCPVCGLSFPVRKTMSLHKCQNQSIPTKEVYYCGDCGKPYITIYNLRRHMFAKHGKSIFWCEKCGDDFTYKSDLELHQVCMHPDAKPFICGKCGKSCPSLTILKEHEFTHSAVQMHTCIDMICDCHYCGKLFTTKDLLKTHLKLHCECTPMKNYLKREDWPFKCEECECRFRYFYALKAHASHMHTILKPLKCPECEKCFASLVILNLHMKTHTTVEPFNSSSSVHSDTDLICDSTGPLKCAECEKCFASRLILNLHMKTHRPLLDDHMNTHRPLLEDHMNTHRPLLEDQMNTHLPICTQQDCDYKNKTSLSGNNTKTPIIKVSAGNKGKKLKDRNSTEKDEQIPVVKPGNEEQKPQSILTTLFTSKFTLCPRSSFQFSQPEDVKTEQLRAHIKTYRVPRECGKINGKRQQWTIKVQSQIPSQDCDKTFTTRNLLQKDWILHRAEWPYKCGMCESRFRKHHHLKKHKLHVHKDHEPYKCSKCGMCFRSSQILTRHMRTHFAFKCSHIGCNQAFCTLVQLNQHQEIHSTVQQANLGNSGFDGDESKEYPCLYCKGKFDTFGEAQTHIKSHGELQLEPVEITSELNMSKKKLNSEGLDTDDNMNSHTDILTDSDFDASMKTHITEPMDCIHLVSADEHNSMDCKKRRLQTVSLPNV